MKDKKIYVRRSCLDGVDPDPTFQGKLNLDPASSPDPAFKKKTRIKPSRNIQDSI